ncbi:MAG: hypothetical protein ACFB8W_10820 [Elainellaceae cyanobacterium]
MLFVYNFSHINLQEFNSRNNDFECVKKEVINSSTAKRIGIISLRAITIYDEVLGKLKCEKDSLKIWVREQRSKARSHGRVFSYKGASKTRSNMNATISNINDRVLNQIETIESISKRNSNLAKLRLEECKRLFSISDIKDYESYFLEEKGKIKDLRLLRNVRTLAFALLGFFLFLTFHNLSLLLILTCILLSGGLVIIQKNISLQNKRFEAAQSSIQSLKLENTLKEQEDREFSKQLEDSIDNDVSDDDESIIIALSKELETEYFLLENACLNLRIDANNWIDLARKIHQFPAKTEQLLEVKEKLVTEEELKNRFNSLKEAKEHFGVTARSWKSLAEKLNASNS